MVMAWEDDARTVLREAGHAVPSRLATRGRRMVSRVWLGVQKSLNVGVGARVNALEAFTAKGQGLTLVLFSAQPEPFLTQNTPWTPPDTPQYPLTPPKHPVNNP